MFSDEKDSERHLLSLNEAVEKINRLESELKKKEEEYIRNLRRNESLLQAIPDIVFVINRDGFYTDYKPDIKNRRDLKPENVIGRNVRDFPFTSQSLEMLFQSIDEIIETGRQKCYRYEFISKRGETVHYKIRLVKLNDNEVMGLTKDITDEIAREEELRNTCQKNQMLNKEIDNRYNAEKELAENEKLLRIITNLAPQAFYCVDLKTNDILYVNDKFLSVWNLESIGELIKSGRIKHSDVLSLCLPYVDDIPQYVELMTKRSCNNRDESIRSYMKLIDGRVLRFFSSYIHDSKGKNTGRLYVFEES